MRHLTFHRGTVNSGADRVVGQGHMLAKAELELNKHLAGPCFHKDEIDSAGLYYSITI